MQQRIRYFLKAAETGSFSLAAQSMFISPQALTKQINVLERDLGGKLFERTTHGIVLTPFGRYAQEKLQRLDREFDNVWSDLRDFAKSDKEQIRIGIFAALPRDQLVSPVVSYLLSAYPERQFNLEMIELDEGRRGLLEGKLDILLSNMHEQDRLEGFDCFTFSEHDARVIVSLAHPWVMKESITLEDMASEPFVKMKMDTGHYTVPWDQSFYRNIPCSRILEASNFETMLVLLHQAAGFGVFPMMFMNMKEARVKSFPYPGQTLRYYTALVVKKEAAEGRLKEVVDGLVDEFDLTQLQRNAVQGNEWKENRSKSL